MSEQSIAHQLPSTSASCEPSLTAPLSLWLFIQCGAIALAAARVPLAARVDPPVDRLAVHYLVVAQVVAAAMLFPILLRDWRTTLVIVVTAWPYAQLAGLLAPIEVTRSLAATACVSAWIVSLACWRAALARCASAQLVAVGVAMSVAVGGPVLWYLHGEFGHGDAAPAAMLGPVMAALAQLSPPPHTTAWIASAATIVISVFAFLISRALANRASRASDINLSTGRPQSGGG